MIEDSNNLKSEIEWVCNDCGKKALGNQLLNYGKTQRSISTYHNGICDVCKQDKPVTETRDFGYPKFEVTK